MNLLDLDARWKRLNDPDYVCPCCGRSFGGVIDIGFEEPEDWPHGPLQGEDMTVGEDRLTPDLCRLMGRYFLRVTLPLPIRGASEAMNVSLWAEVARDTFDAYLDTFDSGAAFTGEGLSANTVPGLDNDATPLALEAANASQRPVAKALDGPMAETQAEGLSLDDLLDLYAASGNDIRPHLKG
ncbi:DUF2199 domain-containing protein [Sagittula sp. NFXS13]|uniref:DUF2199 domain-containing protein n=1 Tax=Sagittula sp. NFXS13 TaxID=2819095 RepID=UPI0032DEDAE2